MRASLQRFLSLWFPMLARHGDPHLLGTLSGLFSHLVILIGTFSGLLFWGPWPPLYFFMLYGLIWLVGTAWRNRGQDSLNRVLQAWHVARTQAARAGHWNSHHPLFWILGCPADSLEPLLRDAGFQFSAYGCGRDAPVRLLAISREGAIHGLFLAWQPSPGENAANFSELSALVSRDRQAVGGWPLQGVFTMVRAAPVPDSESLLLREQELATLQRVCAQSSPHWLLFLVDPAEIPDCQVLAQRAQGTNCLASTNNVTPQNFAEEWGKFWADIVVNRLHDLLAFPNRLVPNAPSLPAAKDHKLDPVFDDNLPIIRLASAWRQLATPQNLLPHLLNAIQHLAPRPGEANGQPFPPRGFRVALAPCNNQPAAFVSGLFDDLWASRNQVHWQPEAYRRNRRSYRRALVQLGMLLIATLVILGCAYYLW